MKIRKKLLCLILSAAMVFGSIPAGVMAEELVVLEESEIAAYDLTDTADGEDLIILEDETFLPAEDAGNTVIDDDLIIDIEEIVIEPEEIVTDEDQIDLEEERDTEIQTETEGQNETEFQSEPEEPVEPEVQSESEEQAATELQTESEEQAVTELQTETELFTDILIDMESLEEIELFSAAEEPLPGFTGSFILAADSGGSLVIAPEYVPYTNGQTVKEVLLESKHSFTGLEAGWITAIDGVDGNYTRSDEDGGYDLDQFAENVNYFRFSEDRDCKPEEGLQRLMKAMADYQLKDTDVKNAAKEAYETAYQQFSGIDDASAGVLAEKLINAMDAYENNLNAGTVAVTFNNGSNTYAGVSIVAENGYGRTWTDEDGNGVLELPMGTYHFCISQDGLMVEGEITVSTEPVTVTAPLPQKLWLKQDAFRISGSYGEEGNEESQFIDDEYKVSAWADRKATVAVPDTFTGKIYTYTEYDTTLLSSVPKLTAVYTNTAGTVTEEDIPFGSLKSGVSGVLGRGAAGNNIVYRISYTEEDGYTYSQDYTVMLDRTPSLISITVKDQEGFEQTPMTGFDGSVKEHIYKVLDTVTSVTIAAEALDAGYVVQVNGQMISETSEGITVNLEEAEETSITVTVSAEGYTNEYILKIRPGEGKTLSFVTNDTDVTVEVVNSSGLVMPFEKFKEGDSGNRYQYILVPGETYNYVVTRDTWYHVADTFTMEDIAGSTINVDVQMEDWLTGLAFGTGTQSANKGNLIMDTAFDPADHNYQVQYVDTEHLAYIWVNCGQDIEIQAMYDQVFRSNLYHGKAYDMKLRSGEKQGVKLERFLMDENPIGNKMIIRLTKEADGVTYYQDYSVDFTRTLTLKDLDVKCDGLTVSPVQKDGTVGFDSDVKEYDLKVSMMAEKVELKTFCYTDNPCYGEAEVGYRVRVDGKDVTAAGGTEIALDGTLNTQTVLITVENDKAPEGSTVYILNLLKSPPVKTTFAVAPASALISIYEVMSDERIWPDENGTYQLCEGYSYNYALSEYGYINKSGTLSVTRDEEERLVITDSSDTYLVTEAEDGNGAVTLNWTLQEAPRNEDIIVDIESDWSNFRGNDDNNAVSDTSIPTKAEDGTLFWANKIGDGIDADAVGSPIIVDGYLITYASDNLYRVDTVTGEIVATAKMDHKSSFSITPPTYADGMVFVALSNGTVQAFNAVTLESLWIYMDPLGGQPNCPLTVKNGYLYTGFWNSETSKANFVCLSITDEDPGQEKERKSASWYYTQAGGFYWAGAYTAGDYVLVGTDDGTNTCTSQTSSMLMLDAKTGTILDCWSGLNGDIRSSVVYDSATNAYYFTSKGGSFYSVQVEGKKFTNKWSVQLSNGSQSTPMSTCSPSVYNGRAYIGVSGAGQFSAYSGHNITVIDLASKSIAYQVPTHGYPQTSGLLTTAYAEESGYVYVYFFDNQTPGTLRVLRDKPGQTSADYVTQEGDITTAYALFTPTGDQAQYAICSPIVDEYGTIYFKNDSAHLMAFGSAIEKIEVTKQPDKMSYREGDSFDPTGMVVTATYVNGKTRDITRYVTFNKEPLSASDSTITIAFEYVMYHNAENGTGMNTGVQTTTPVTTLKINILSADAGYVPGDVNQDDMVNAKDADLVVSYYYGTTTLNNDQKALADMNQDGCVDIRDANRIVFEYSRS
ncbi:PQQ-binding-like beta-propeller repeat protein [Ruminococcus sp. 5_1_39BFAA]|uniref:outer membrane protein assembly factor BamB family protein n=1 Tax=Ruminococcus sp. 5_1_39BFAA TaxID=457412 RepID=UPI003566DFBB